MDAPRPKPPRRPHPVLYGAAISVGLLAGIGLFTFHYAGGLSYFSTAPEACKNCHIMRPQFESWQKSSHHTAAVCVDCHLPQAFIPKYLAKASNGWHHSKGFTLQDFPEPIRIKPGNAAILQENCRRCHDPMVHELLPAGRPHQVAGGVGSPEAGGLECVHCHAGVGHGATAGLGPRRGEAERETTEPTYHEEGQSP